MASVIRAFINIPMNTWPTWRNAMVGMASSCATSSTTSSCPAARQLLSPSTTTDRWWWTQRDCPSAWFTTIAAVAIMPTSSRVVMPSMRTWTTTDRSTHSILFIWATRTPTSMAVSVSTSNMLTGHWKPASTIVRVSRLWTQRRWTWNRCSMPTTRARL